MSEQTVLIQQLKLQGVTEPQVLNAIKNTPREKFVLPSYQNQAYENTALPIESKQTISQPYIVALMTQALLTELKNPMKILEIGTGSGYQTAILSTLFPHVWTIERIDTLYEKAKITLKNLGYTNISFKLGDGALGWAEHSPFDGIIVTASANVLPPKLLEQLSDKGGVMIIPLGAMHQVQKLTIIKKQGNNVTSELLELVSFVPLVTD